MTSHPHVPADDDADSILDLVDDCREVSGVLAPFGSANVRIPLARSAMPVDIATSTAARLDGWGEYGS